MKKPAKTETIRLRVTPHENIKLKIFASNRDLSVSRVLREYIRRLPCELPLTELPNESDNLNHEI